LVQARLPGVGLQIPEINGRARQQLINEQDIPIIFISGHDRARGMVQAMKVGATDFPEKPFWQNTLVACIETAFETIWQQDLTPTNTTRRGNYAPSDTTARC